MLIITTRDNFLVVEYDRSIGTFNNNASRVSFNLHKNSHSEEVPKEIIDLTPV